MLLSIPLCYMPYSNEALKKQKLVNYSPKHKNYLIIVGKVNRNLHCRFISILKDEFILKWVHIQPYNFFQQSSNHLYLRTELAAINLNDQHYPVSPLGKITLKNFALFLQTFYGNSDAPCPLVLHYRIKQTLRLEREIRKE